MLVNRVGLAFIACMAAPAVAMAQADYARDGAYLGLAGSVGIYTEAEDDLEDFFGDADIDPAVGLNVRAGYRMHPHFALEGEFEWLSEADIEVGGQDVATVQSFTGTVNGKGYLLKGRVQPFALIGLGGMGVRVEGGGGSDAEGGFAARFGGGVDIYITENFLAAIDASYMLPTGNADGADFVSIGWGFGYRF
jgi:opacity protein-like surface antigen